MVNHTILAGNENITTFEEMIIMGNTATGGFFAPVILLTIWLILFLSLSMYRGTEAWTAASFISFLISTVFWGMGILNPIAVALLALMTIAGAFYADKRKV